MGHVDKNPGHTRSPFDVERGHVVGWASEPTRPTSEGVPIGTVASFSVPTRRAGLGRVGRIHLEDRNPGPHALVADAFTKLAERPAGERRPLVPVEPSPVANALQVLQG